MWAPITSGLVGVSPQNLIQTTCRESGMIKYVWILEGLPPKIWEGEKTSKIPRWITKIWWTLVHKQKSYRAHIDPPKRTFFGRLYLGPWGAHIFTWLTDWRRLASANHNCEGAPPKKFNRENLKFGLKFSVWAPITSRLVGVPSQNFFQGTCWKAGVIKWV